MKSIQSQKFYANADRLLQVADAEMNRAAEDAVTHLICHNSRESISHYLQGYLLKRKVVPTEPITINSLLEQCAELDPHFRNIDFTKVPCRFETQATEYCLDMETVKECYDVARRTEKLVKQ